LAQMAEDMWASNLSEEQYKVKTEAITRPSNLIKLVPPRVNDEIWKHSSVTPGVRTKDLKYQRTQNLLTKSSISIFNVIDGMLKTPHGLDRAAMKEVIEKLVASAQLISSACHEINYRRKDNLRSVLPQHLAPLCSNSKDVTDHLFGDNACKSVKEIADTNRALQSHFKGKAPRKAFLGYAARGRGKPYSPQSHMYMPQLQSMARGQAGQWYRGFSQGPFSQFGFHHRGSFPRSRGSGRGPKRGKARGGQ
jgi:hypothetical protein